MSWLVSGLRGGRFFFFMATAVPSSTLLSEGSDEEAVVLEENEAEEGIALKPFCELQCACDFGSVTQ
jgi:hypothetical protein